MLTLYIITISKAGAYDKFVSLGNKSMAMEYHLGVVSACIRIGLLNGNFYGYEKAEKPSCAYFDNHFLLECFYSVSYVSIARINIYD